MQGRQAIEGALRIQLQGLPRSQIPVGHNPDDLAVPEIAGFLERGSPEQADDAARIGASHQQRLNYRGMPSRAAIASGV